MRLMRLFAVSAVLAGSVVGFSGSASAEPFCEQAWLRGEIVAPTDLGTCTVYQSPFCEFESVGASGQMTVFVNVCLPPDTL